MPLLGQDLFGALSKRVAILGPGLIGGSLAMALRRSASYWRVSVWARREEAAQEAALLLPGCRVSSDIAATVADCDLAVLCMSPHAIEAFGPDLKKILPPGAALTDAGSVKQKIVRSLEAFFGGRFIGAHPMAGSEQSGIRAAREDLYDGAVCILTPTASSETEAYELVARMWAAAGCDLREMPPSTHDRVIARVSHLPHAAAAALVLAAVSADPRAAEFSGGGYRDSTRIACGPEGLWAEILLDNRDEVVAGIHDMQTALGLLKSALAEGDRPALESFLSQARMLRARTQ